MLRVTHWFVGRCNGQPVDIFYVEDEDPEEEFHPDNYPIYANRVSTVTYEGHGRILPLDGDTLHIDSKTVIVKQIVEDQDGMRHWKRVPYDIKVLFKWTGRIEKDDERRL